MLIGGSRSRVMRYLDVKNGKEEEDHWIGLSDLERERFEHHADFLIDQGYMAVDPYTLAVKVAWKLRNSPRLESPARPAATGSHTHRSTCRGCTAPGVGYPQCGAASRPRAT